MSKRLFLAIGYSPSTTIKKAHSSLQNDLSAERLKFVALQEMHLSLKFLGNTTAENEKNIIKICKEIANSTTNISLNINGIGAFYNGKQPTVLFFKPAPSQQLNILAKMVETRLQSIGIAKEKRSYNPHITIARIKDIKNIPHFSNIIKRSFNEQFTAKSFILFESKRTQSGHVYSIIEEFNF